MQKLFPTLSPNNFDMPIPPGAHLQEWCEEHNMELTKATKRLSLSITAFENLISGQQILDRTLADKLSDLTRVPTSLWLNLENLYRSKLTGRGDSYES